MNYPYKAGFPLFRKNRFQNFIWLLVFSLSLVISTGYAPAQISAEEINNIHKSYDILLQLYVSGDRFDYNRMWNSEEDIQRLAQYIDTLETLNPADWSRNDALAYWINLYNAATIELVLTSYPIKSIKDIGGFMRKSPWNRKVVTVAGQEMTLNDIEDKISTQFQDARVYFALNNATVSYPPLSGRAYLGESLENQLEAVCFMALKDERWVKITDNEILISQIFDWHKNDFIKSAGSIREFIAKYREDDREAIMDAARPLKFMNYNWDLNMVAL